jgi:hypothetical protein
VSADHVFSPLCVRQAGFKDTSLEIVAALEDNAQLKAKAMATLEAV